MSGYIKDRFINYAHRGASEYAPENTMMSFYLGLYMGANGIETDVQRTKDGVLVLFHDDSLTRVTGAEDAVCDYSFSQLQQLQVKKDGLTDRIVSLEDFLQHFSHYDITFAIELKQPGTERETVDMLRRYDMRHKTVITSFERECLLAVREYAPEFKIGLLTEKVDGETLAFLKGLGAEELCPKADRITPQRVARWHSMGFSVRAWGVSNEKKMKRVYDSGADGMTVNFPDKLQAYMAENSRRTKHFVYIVRCCDGSLYTGWTTDVLRRVETHNSGQGAKYTRSRLPVELVYYEQLSDKSAALKREKTIKAMSRAQKKRLVARRG